MHAAGFLASRHSHMRITCHCRWRSRRVTRLSLSAFPVIFRRHSLTLVFGVMFLPQLWPCQKQPSTKTASLSDGHTKSGFPTRGQFRRQPLRCAFLSNAARRISVVSLRLLRTRDINCPRERPPNVVRSFSAFPGHLLISLAPLVTHVDS